MNISSLLLSLSFARLSGPFFLSHGGGCCMELGLLQSRPVPASPVPATFLPRRPPHPTPLLAAAASASPSRPALLSLAPPPRPLPAQDCVPGIVSCGLKSPFLPLSWMCLVCLSFPRVREDAWGCAGMNFGRGAYVPQKTVFLHPTFPSTSSSVSFI